MYCITLLGNQMPATYKLLFGYKPQMSLPSIKSVLEYKHVEDSFHQEAKKYHQTKSAEFYDYKSGNDIQILNNMESSVFWNTLKYFGTNISI